MPGDNLPVRESCVQQQHVDIGLLPVGHDRIGLGTLREAGIEERVLVADAVAGPIDTVDRSGGPYREAHRPDPLLRCRGPAPAASVAHGSRPRRGAGRTWPAGRRVRAVTRRDRHGRGSSTAPGGRHEPGTAAATSGRSESTGSCLAISGRCQRRRDAGHLHLGGARLAIAGDWVDDGARAGSARWRPAGPSGQGRGRPRHAGVPQIRQSGTSSRPPREHRRLVDLDHPEKLARSHRIGPRHQPGSRTRRGAVTRTSRHGHGRSYSCLTRSPQRTAEHCGHDSAYLTGGLARA